MKNLNRVLMLMGLAVLVAGCSGGDDDIMTPPNNTSIMTGETAEQYVVSALSSVTEVALVIPDFAAGDFSSWNSSLAAKSEEEPTWNAGQMAYVFAYDGPVLELQAPNYWTVVLDLWVQFRDAAGPVQDPEMATAMEVRYDVGMDMYVEGEGSVADLDYDFGFDVVVSNLGEGDDFAMVGTGSSYVDYTGVSPQSSESGTFAMNWAADLVVPQAGCPSGTVTVNGDGYSVQATYDGAGSVDWTMSGHGYNGSGTDTLPCQPVM